MQRAAKAKEVKDLKIAMVARTYDKAGAYTNLIIGAGYAGAFAVWGFTREHLPPTATIWVALFLSGSLAGFVAFEVYQMWLRTNQLMKQRQLITQELDPETFLRLHHQYAREADLAHARLVIPKWRIVMFWCAFTGLVAALMLLYNFVAFLFGLPGWPT